MCKLKPPRHLFALSFSIIILSASAIIYLVLFYFFKKLIATLVLHPIHWSRKDDFGVSLFVIYEISTSVWERAHENVFEGEAC